MNVVYPDWTALINDIWSRVLLRLYPDDLITLAHVMCTCRSLKLVVLRLLSSVELFKKNPCIGDKGGDLILWVIRHCPKLRIFKTSFLQGHLKLNSTPPVHQCVKEIELISANLKFATFKKLFQNVEDSTITFPNLERLDLSSSYFLDNTKQKWLKSECFPSLINLDLSWCSNLNPSMVLEVLPRLKSVSFHFCSNINDLIILMLGNIEVLDLAFTAITDNGLKTLAIRCQSLRTLVLADPQHANNWVHGYWTAIGLTYFKQRKPSVVVELTII